MTFQPVHNQECGERVFLFGRSERSSKRWRHPLPDPPYAPATIALPSLSANRRMTNLAEPNRQVSRDQRTRLNRHGEGKNPEEVPRE
jgi:hypothetical protein